MDRDTVVELIPHYVAMLVLVYLVLGVVDATTGGVSFWVELAIIVVVVALYRPVVAYLDVAPSHWEK